LPSACLPVKMKVMPRQAPFGIEPPGYRLPAVARVGAVHLQVPQLARSLAFYQDVLGLRVVERDQVSAALGAPGTGGAGGADAAEPPLLSLRARPGTRPARPGSLGLYHFAILLPSREALGGLIAHLETLGVPFGGGDHLVSEAVYLSDPDGLGIEVYADRPREQWRVRGRELVMATEPLDADDLVRAAGGRGWEGLPAGSRVGHVHLSVGDLEQAEAFYHRALGLDKVVWSYPGALFFSAGGYHHHLGANTWGRGEAAGAEEARLLSWELQLPGGDAVEEAARSLEAAGYSVERSGTGWSASDPWGQALHCVPGPIS